MNDAFRAAGVPLFVAYYRRALPRFLEVRRLLDSGRHRSRDRRARARVRAAREGRCGSRVAVRPGDRRRGALLSTSPRTVSTCSTFLLGPIAEAAGLRRQHGRCLRGRGRHGRRVPLRARHGRHRRLELQRRPLRGLDGVHRAAWRTAHAGVHRRRRGRSRAAGSRTCCPSAIPRTSTSRSSRRSSTNCAAAAAANQRGRAAPAPRGSWTACSRIRAGRSQKPELNSCLLASDHEHQHASHPGILAPWNSDCRRHGARHDRSGTRQGRRFARILAEPAAGRAARGRRVPAEAAWWNWRRTSTSSSGR